MKKQSITILLIISFFMFQVKGVQSQSKTFNYDNPELVMDNLEFADDWYSLDISKDFYKIDISKLSYKLETEYNNYRSLIPFNLKTIITEDNDFIVIMLQGRQWGILNRDKKFIAKNWQRVYQEDNVVIGMRQNNKNLTEPISEPGTYYFQVIADEIPKTEQIIYLYVARIKHNLSREEFALINAENKQARSFNQYLPEMVLVQGGTFTMGCTAEQGSDCYDSERPSHKVTLSDYYIGKYEVTIEQFKQFIDETGYETDADKKGWSFVNGFFERKKGVNWRYDNAGNMRPPEEYNHPVIHVSWNDAVKYCEWISNKTGKAYRLPTEAEWEYAARGGSKTQKYKYAGSNNIDEVAVYESNSHMKTNPVGSLKPNELGVYDMSGNVLEFCSDWFGDLTSESKTNPGGPLSGISRTIRGGGWFYGKRLCRISNRSNVVSNKSDSSFGFRIAFTEGTR